MRDEGDASLSEVLAEVRRIEVQSRRLVRDAMVGGWSSVFRGAGVEFEEVREWVEGDDPRAIDWNVTARAGRPFVKKHRSERELPVLFALDLSASSEGGFGLWSARQTAARVVACLALAAVRTGDKVGLVAFGDRVLRRVPAQRGRAHALRIVRDALVLDAPAGRTDPGVALDLLARAERRRAVVFLVSDFLWGTWPRALASCARRHDVIAVRLLLPELAPPATGGLERLRDPETLASVVVDWTPKAREAYAARAARARARADEALARAGVDVMDVPVPREAGRDLVAGPILRFFRMRELRGAKA